MNCLLVRELPFALGIRLFDTLLAEGARMKEFLAYVLAAFLLSWARQLRAMDFQACPLWLFVNLTYDCLDPIVLSW